MAGTTAELVLPGTLMRLVADGLTARGFGVRLPKYEDERRISVERWGGRCDLSLNDFGLVEWECVPWSREEPDPKLTADIATFLLTGKADDCPAQKNSHGSHGTSFLGNAGYELRARGFAVCLEVFEDNTLFEVWADILVKNRAAHPNALVRISEDGAISWEYDFYLPYEVAGISGSVALENNLELSDSIVTTVAGAVALSSGRPVGDADV
jgi:hypothetical protein